MKEKFLPLGTIVKLKKTDKRIFITGYLIQTKEKEKIYDYSGFSYPEGMVDPQKIILFNHSDIIKVEFEGFNNKEWKEYNDLLNKTINDKKNENFVDTLD